VCGDCSLGGVILLDVDRDAMRFSETVILRWRTVQRGQWLGGGGRRRVSNLQRDAARQETVDFQLSNDDIWVLRRVSC